MGVVRHVLALVLVIVQEQRGTGDDAGDSVDPAQFLAA